MDISHTIVAKSDQLNACGLLGGPINVTVVKVDVSKGSDQPVSIHIGDGRQPFKPCKSVLRVLAKLWGTDSSQWTGRHMTLYCDENVTWAGEQCGGIRVSHLSDIKGKQEVTVRASKHKVLKVIVYPFVVTVSIQYITKEQSKELWTIAQSVGMSAASYGAWMQDEFKIKSSAEIKTDEFEHIKKEIQQMIKVDVPEI